MDHPTNLIFVEDNPSDIRLFKYALSQADTDVALLHYENGQDFLQAVPDLYAANIGCILVDLNMPFVGGFEVIEALRKNEDFQHTPIIVFTSTKSNDEKLRAYSLGANAYISKPFEIDDLVTTVQAIIDFWLKCNARVLQSPRSTFRKN